MPTVASENAHRSPRSVLITGATGYIGRLFTRALAEAPGSVERIVATDIRPPTEADRLDNVTYLELDVRAPQVAEVMTEHRIDTVVHLAAVVTPGPGMTRETMYAIDVDGTENILRACVAAGTEKFIVTSSGAAYGYHRDNAAGLTEDDPLRGNETFAYSHHKRLVEEMLARYREEHPDLQQLIFRVGTILGASVSNQITDLFEKPWVMGLDSVATPFVFIWDGDVVGAILAGVFGQGHGIFNLAGDGTVTLGEIAARLKKPYITLKESWITTGLSLAYRFGLSQYGPEQVGFLRYRPVLLNDRLKNDFGYTPRFTSREVFEIYRGKLQP